MKQKNVMQPLIFACFSHDKEMKRLIEKEKKKNRNEE